MRKLLYVPIIHNEADLGRLGPALEKRSASLYGEKRWAEHKETVTRFWQSIADYLLSLDITTLKIYQDGLAVDGELGKRVIKEAAERGSANHQLLLQLISQGAEVRRTEDAFLLMQELRLVQEECAGENSFSPQALSLSKARLMKERDRFTASTIAETLGQEETGVLFIGAYHNVHLYLPEDIVIAQLKEIEKLRAYFTEIVSGGKEERLEQLARYLASPIAISS